MGGLQIVGYTLDLMQLKYGRRVVAFRKGTIPGAPNRAMEYSGRGMAGRLAAELRNMELGFGRRKERHRKSMHRFGDIAYEYGVWDQVDVSGQRAGKEKIYPYQPGKGFLQIAATSLKKKNSKNSVRSSHSK